ncbi:uncharacterized protein N7459_002502 [Penicillium hispanicum]|uniref:uncharacterized protein n=1 Tax=Penicillium hispanicum TaxID=1080232 RepID=UPI00253FD6FE|nr:uncharacterized protein N7459_002502 [Penicillium hispanicum]KAJ5586737.1 hypothetical protein N7459_002502 [Penicillium hispanicum]
MRLFELPDEVLLYLADFLSQKELNNLLQTNQYFRAKLDTYLYRRDCHKVPSFVLTWASWKGRERTARKALVAGANVEQTDKLTIPSEPVRSELDSDGANSKLTPLYIAAMRRHMAVVKLLLEEGAQVDSKSHVPRLRVPRPRVWEHICDTPLASATRCGYLDVMQILLEHGANPNQMDRHEVTPFTLAMREGSPESIRLLLSHGADFGNTLCLGRAPITWASYGRLEIFKLLLEHGADVGQGNELYRNPLSEAVRSGHREIVDIILERVNINHQGGSHVATGRTALGVAISQRRMELTYLLLEKGADPNHVGPASDPASCAKMETPLWLAARRQSKDLVLALLAKGADPNIAVEGKTPLFMTVQYRNEALAVALLEYGADPNTPSLPAGQTCLWVPLTPLARAMRDANYSMAKLLLNHGADPNVTGWKGQTMLIRAIPKMGYEYIERMLVKGANPNAAAPHERTPLFLAIMRGDQSLAGLLLRYGADPTLKRQSMTLLDWALRKSQAGMGAILREHGGKNSYEPRK